MSNSKLKFEGSFVINVLVLDSFFKKRFTDIGYHLCLIVIDVPKSSRNVVRIDKDNLICFLSVFDIFVLSIL